MSRHVLDGGHEVTVHDIRRDAAAPLLEEGALWASDPAETARGKEIVFLSLPLPRDVKEVVLGDKGVVHGAHPGQVVIDMSTNSLDTVLELGEQLSARGVHFMDVPVSGGVRGAESRDLCVMAGGSREDYDRVKPVLDLIGDKVMYCGPVGHGTVCKLCHQLFAAGISQVIAEVLTTGVKAGVDLMTLVETMSKSAAGKHPPLSGWLKGPPKGDYRPTPYSFTLRLMRKDVSLACELGRKFDVPMEIGNIIEQRFIAALNRGWGDMETGILLRLQEERAGVRLSSSDGAGS